MSEGGSGAATADYVTAGEMLSGVPAIPPGPAVRVVDQAVRGERPQPLMPRQPLRLVRYQLARLAGADPATVPPVPQTVRGRGHHTGERAPDIVGVGADEISPGSGVFVRRQGVRKP